MPPSTCSVAKYANGYVLHFYHSYVEYASERPIYTLLKFDYIDSVCCYRPIGLQYHILHCQVLHCIVTLVDRIKTAAVQAMNISVTNVLI